MRILVLEDDSFIADEIALYFTKKHHEVVTFQSGKKLFEYPNLHSFDIFLFDINMPLKNGIEILEELRSCNVTTPTIFLTSMSDLEYLKKAYKAGGSDYVRKPFHFEELEIRIEQLLGASKRLIKISKLHSFNLSTMELYEKEKPIELTQNEAKLLYLLISNLNHTVPSDRLIEYIWSEKDVSENTLRTTIKKLRAKIAKDFIVNIRGYGYKIESP